MFEKSAAWVSVIAMVFVATTPLVRAERVKRDVPFVPTPQEVVDKMLQMANVKSTDVVYDLGCGDGRIVITAARKYGARGTGVDIDPERIRESTENARRQGVSDKVRFANENLFQMNFRDATVVTLYLLPSVNVKLRPKLLNELKPGTRVVSHAFDMGDWEPDRTDRAEGRSIYLWIIPAKVAGTWNSTLQTPEGPRQATLELQQKYQTVSGTAQIGDRKLPIKDGRVNGDELTFTLNDPQRQGVPVRYSCRVEGNSIRGTAQAMANHAQGIEWHGTRK